MLQAHFFLQSDRLYNNLRRIEKQRDTNDFLLKLFGISLKKKRNPCSRCSISFEMDHKQDFHILAKERKTFLTALSQFLYF